MATTIDSIERADDSLNPTSSNPTSSNPTSSNPTSSNPITGIPASASPASGNPTPGNPTTAGVGAEVYQSVSQAAVASLVLGFFGLASLLFAPMIAVPLVGIVFAFIAFNAFRKFPDEYLGRPVAYIGATLCGLTLLIAPTWHTYVYLTEVPEGYARVDFGALMSDPGKADVPTQFAVDLNGEPIFIKGYIHPTSMDSLQAKRFVLVPDLGTCCFGGQPPLTHMIEVSLTGDQYATRSYSRQRLAGTFKVNQGLKPIEGLTGVFYQLKADVLK